MKRMRILSVCLLGLLQPGPSMGADCGALPSDSLFQVECKYIKQRVAASKALPAQVIAAPESPPVVSTRPRPRAVEAPPLRRQGDEPLMTIFLLSGSTIRVDRTWVRGDRLFYISRDVGGSIALNDVSRVEDLMVKLRPAPGR